MFFSCADFSWSNPVILTIPSYKDNKKTCEIKVADPKGVILCLSVECLLEKEGNCLVSVYCPYWIVNYTGLTMLYKKKSGSDTEDIEDVDLVAGHYIKNDEYSDDNEYVSVVPGAETPFMCSESQIRIKIDASGWSSPVTLSKSGSLECISLPETMYPDSKKLFLIGASMDSAQDQFWRTKIVKFTSWYLLVNDTMAPLYVRQQGTGTDFDENDESITRLNPGESKPFHWFDKNAPHKVCVSQGGSEWSNGLLIEKVGTFPFKLRPYNNNNSSTEKGADGERRLSATMKKTTFYNVIVNTSNKGEEASTTVRFIKSHERFPPYKIENKTALLGLSVFQRDIPDAASTFAEEVDPGETLPYCWDDLCAPHVLRISFYGYDEHADFELDSLRLPYAFAACGMEFLVSVSADGPTRVFRIEDQLVGPAKTVAQSAASAKGQDGEGEVGLSFSVKLPEIGLSLVDSVPQELLYMTLSDTNVGYAKTTAEESFEVGIFSVQIDNQLYNTPYPVLMLPRNSSYGRDNYFIHVSVRKRREEKIDYFEYFAVSVKEMNIFLEETLFYLLRNFYVDVSKSFSTYAVSKDTAGTSATAGDKDKNDAAENKEDAKMMTGSDDCSYEDEDDEEIHDRMAYFEVMYINSIYISLSFQSSSSNDIPTEGSFAKIMSLTT